MLDREPAVKGKVVYFVVPHEKNISRVGISSAMVNNLIVLVNDVVIKVIRSVRHSAD